MSDLRKQLDAAKDQYRAARYPGNLADELLAPRRTSSIRLYIGVIGTLAAAAVVGFLLLRPNATLKTIEPGKPTVIAQAPTSQAADEDVSLADLAAMPDFPEDVSPSPAATTQPIDTAIAATDAQEAAPSLGELGSMPSLPSMDFSFSFSDLSDTGSGSGTSNQTETSKEST